MRLRLVLPFALAALAAPGVASAHVRTDVVAVDFRAHVLVVPQALRGAGAVHVYAGDEAIGLSVRAGHRVVVLGYVGEPFVRIGPGGVAVNSASPTAAAAGLAHRGAGWKLWSRNDSIVWHDSRIRGVPQGVRHAVWRIPLLVDGQRVALRGDITRAGAPSPWPWLAFGAMLPVVAVLLLRGGAAARSSAIALGVAAAAATAATAASFALTRSASVGRWLEGGAELVFVALCLGFVVAGPRDARGIAGGAMGLVAVSCAVTKLPVFLHGVVLAAVPATMARALVACTLSLGLAAAAAGLVEFFAVLERPLTLGSGGL